MKIEVLCPAKINTFLAVGPVDSRRYHPIRSIFHAVSLFDRLVIESADEDSFFCDDPGIPDQNSVTTAVSRLREIAGFETARITLEKRIPYCAGLGGGSSDAAGILRASAMMSDLRPAPYELKAVARSLGADVPFFLLGGSAKAEGYGEKLTPVEFPRRWFVIAKPDVDSATPQAYRRLDEKLYEFRDFPDLPTSPKDEFYNDFERVADCSSLDLIEILQVRGALASGLTGSGSAVVGEFPDEEKAHLAAEAMKQDAPFVTVAHSLTPSESQEIIRLD